MISGPRWIKPDEIRLFHNSSGLKSSSSQWLLVEIWCFFKSTIFTSSTFPVQPDFSQNQPAAITLNTSSPRTLLQGKLWMSSNSRQCRKGWSGGSSDGPGESPQDSLQKQGLRPGLRGWVTVLVLGRWERKKRATWATRATWNGNGKRGRAGQGKKKVKRFVRIVVVVSGQREENLLKADRRTHKYERQFDELSLPCTRLLNEAYGRYLL